VDQYAQHLRFQVAALRHWPPTKCRVTYTCFFTYEDMETSSVVGKLARHQSVLPDNVVLAFVPLEPAALFRRAIGRNMVAKETTADVVWFTDIDYFAGPSCLDSIAELVDKHSGLVFPETYWINRESEHGTPWQTGDQIVRWGRQETWPKADLSLFAEKRQRVCIGGMQIVGGELARRIGYLDGTKWVEPVDPSLGFRSCRCDAAFRRSNRLDARKLPIRGMYRLRHGTDGRDFTATGVKEGKEAW
jgi:hypothetical protein